MTTEIERYTRKRDEMLLNGRNTPGKISTAQTRETRIMLAVLATGDATAGEKNMGLDEQWLTKDALVAVPIAATALALSFDVGYFYGTDINYFSVFSISEHVTFATEVLPAALLSAIASVFIVSLPNPIKTRPWLRPLMLAFGLANIVLGVVYYHAYWMATVTIATALISRFVYPFKTYTIGFAFLFGAGVSFAFAAGLDMAQAYRSLGVYPSTITTDVDIKARVVRSGERGVLFYEQNSRKLMLLPWSDIKKISLDLP